MIRTVRAAVIAALVTGAPAVASGQERPDFSGVWIVDEESIAQGRAELVRRPSGGAGRPVWTGGVPADRLDDANRPVEIYQSDDELEIRRGSSMLAYRLDGGETINLGSRGERLTSTARWEGEALVLESRHTVATARGSRVITTREVRTLTGDRSTMTVEMTMELPIGTRTATLLYWRSEE